VTIVLTTDRAERGEPGSVLYAGDRRLEIDASRAHGRRLIVHFTGVDDRDAAEALTGSVLTADPLERDDVLWVHELVGAPVRDTHGTPLGTITAVEANPAHDLLVLDDGMLVPMVFVVEHGPDGIVVDPPDGLIPATGDGA